MRLRNRLSVWYRFIWRFGNYFRTKLIFDVRPLTAPGNYTSSSLLSSQYSTINPRHNSSYTSTRVDKFIFNYCNICQNSHVCHIPRHADVLCNLNEPDTNTSIFHTRTTRFLMKNRCSERLSKKMFLIVPEIRNIRVCICYSCKLGRSALYRKRFRNSS